MLAVFLGLFIYFILQPALYSPDSYGYLRGDFQRFPGYVIFTRIFTIVFKAYFNTAVIAVQLILGFVGVFIFLQKASNLFKLNFWLKIAMFVLLVYPFFPEQSVANNITSEGFAYAFYLLLIAFSLDFLFRKQTHKIWHLSICFTLLTLTRGQFILVPLLLALIYLLQNRKDTFSRLNIRYFIVLLILPLVTSNVNKTYNKIIYGYYVATPFSYINAVTLPLYIAAEKDSLAIKNEVDKLIFQKSLHQIDTAGLRSKQVKGDANKKYMVFHEHFPEICNQNIFVHGIEYFNDQDGISTSSSVKIEQTSKRLFPILIKENFEEYISLYFAGVFHGFQSIYIAIFVFLVFLYSVWLCIKKVTVLNASLLLFTLLIFSNAALVAVACHSIQRYLFYNYCVGFLILLILFKKITTTK